MDPEKRRPASAPNEMLNFHHGAKKQSNKLCTLIDEFFCPFHEIAKDRCVESSSRFFRWCSFIDGSEEDFSLQRIFNVSHWKRRKKLFCATENNSCITHNYSKILILAKNINQKIVTLQKPIQSDIYQVVKKISWFRFLQMKFKKTRFGVLGKFTVISAVTEVKFKMNVQFYMHKVHVFFSITVIF